MVAEIEGRRAELVELCSELVAFDTTARAVGDAPRDEAALQRHLAERLAAAGAAIDLWEPDAATLPRCPLVPPGLDFAGRPQLAARFGGAGGGRSLLLNGHVDVVSVEPRERWSSDPRRAETRDGKLYGRGACDMKGGVAAMTLAACVLAELGVRLRGDLTVCTVTDEESFGAGGLAAVAHGLRADAGIVTEPSRLRVWITCRGSLIPVVTVEGRPGHAGMAQPDWRDGGAVNAIEKGMLVANALRELDAEWRRRPDLQHPHLSPSELVLTEIEGGEWSVSYPARCRLVYHVAYLPGQADAGGWGSAVAEEIETAIAAAAGRDAWLAEHPPRIEWTGEVPPAEVDSAHPIVGALLEAASVAGRPSTVAGLDNWHDGATFTLLGETPCVCFGPGDIAHAHAIDEHVPVDDLVDCAKAVALTAMRFCGVAGG